MLPAIEVQSELFEITQTGLKINGKFTFEEWLRFGDTLYGIHQSVQWAIADWLNIGEERFGEKAAQAMDITRYSYDWIAQLKSLAKTFPVCSREQKRIDGSLIPITTYRAVAAFPEPVRTKALQESAVLLLSREDTRAVALKLTGKTTPPHWEKVTEIEENEYQHISGKFKVVVWKWVS